MRCCWTWGTEAKDRSPTLYTIRSAPKGCRPNCPTVPEEVRSAVPVGAENPSKPLTWGIREERFADIGATRTPLDTFRSL